MSTPSANLSSHLANERTHLAYLRTSISLMTFGVTLNKFSLWLLQHESAPASARPLRDASNVGWGMVVVGLALLAWSLYRFWQVSRDIDRGVFVARYRAVFVVSLVLLLIGGASALWLFLGKT